VLARGGCASAVRSRPLPRGVKRPGEGQIFHLFGRQFLLDVSSKLVIPEKLRRDFVIPIDVQ
jgi:hypothetical protein